MPAVTKRPKTEFGLEVREFTGREGITLKELAAAAGVKYTTMVDTMTGRCAGHQLIPIVRSFMFNYEGDSNSAEHFGGGQ